MTQEIEDMNSVELLDEYESCVRHLQNCRVEGQVDKQQMNEKEGLEEEIQRRMLNNIQRKYVYRVNEEDGSHRVESYHKDEFKFVLNFVVNYIDDIDALCDFLRTEYRAFEEDFDDFKK
jgi:hypothetical protein